MIRSLQQHAALLWRKQYETINSGHTEYTCGNSRPFEPDGNSTKPGLSCGDKLKQDSSMLVHTAVWSPTPSDKINLCHLHIANACNETKFHLASNEKQRKKRSEKKARKTGSSDCMNIYNGHQLGAVFWAEFWGHAFRHLPALRFHGV